MAPGGVDDDGGRGEPARAPSRVVFAEEVEVPNALQRLKLAMRDPAFHTKKLTLWFRTAQVVFGLTAVILSAAYDLPRGVRFRVKNGDFVLIDAGVITSMFHFPAYVYITTISLITLLGALLFLVILVVDLSLANGSSDTESVRFRIDNNVPFVALVFDFIFLVLSMTSACAVLGLTNVMRANFDPTGTNFAKTRAALWTIFDLKYAAASMMLAQSVFITATLVLGWKHIEERRKHMTQLGIPPQATQQNIDKIFSFWKTISSGVGKRAKGNIGVDPLFLNRVAQVLFSMAAFTCCYILISDAEMEAVLKTVPPFQVNTWVSCAVLVTSVGIAVVSAIDIGLTGGSKEGHGGGHGGAAATESSAEFRGILQSGSAQFKENLIYGTLIYDAVFSLLTFSTFAASAGVTSAGLNCASGDKRWCPLSGLGVFFVFMQSLSFQVSLFTGSYIQFRDFRIRAVSLEVQAAKSNKGDSTTNDNNNSNL